MRDTQEKFREVEELEIDGLLCASVTSSIHARLIALPISRMPLLSVREARALRDWLNEALPEEKP